MRPFTSGPIAAATAALLLACGSSPPPEEVARTYVASDDPEKCGDAAIEFLERQTGRRGEDARATCERNVERSDPPSGVRVVGHRVRGDRAQVRLEAGGQDVRVDLERRDGDWKVTGFGS